LPALFVGALAVYLVYRDGLVSAGLPKCGAPDQARPSGRPFGRVRLDWRVPYSLLTALIAEIAGNHGAVGRHRRLG